MLEKVKDLGQFVSQPQIGKFYFYWYSPKTKDELPVYDRFPFVMPIEPYQDGWLGINFHYLPLRERKALLAQLFTIANNKKFDDTTKIKARYAVLNNTKKFKAFEPCIKRYLTQHLRSRIIEIHPQNWKIALTLPVQRFVPGRPY